MRTRRREARSDVHRRVQTQSLVDDGTKELHVADVVVRRPAGRADDAEDLLPETVEHVLVLRQTVDRERQRTCSGITAGKEDIQSLVTNDVVVCPACGG